MLCWILDFLVLALKKNIIMKRRVVVMFCLGLLLSSCNKEEVQVNIQKDVGNIDEKLTFIDKVSSVVTLDDVSDDFLKDKNFKEVIPLEKVKYMNSLPFTDLEEYSRKLGELKLQGDRAHEVWGVGNNERVYKYNGSGWSEPNPAAHLKFVEVGSYGSGVWGVGSDTRIYKWNESTNSWDEPNPNAGGYYITAYSETVAIVMGYGGTLYITYDGGVKWERFTHVTGVRWMSVVNFLNNCWIVYSNARIYQFGYSSQQWGYRPTPGNGNIRRVSAMFTNGAYSIESPSLDIYKDYGINSGITVYQPNVNAGAYLISSDSYGDLGAWALGSNDRVFKTTTGGGSWTEPNPGAGLVHISAN